MRRKGRKRVFTIFIALVLVIILVSLSGNFVKAQTSSGGDGYADAIIPNASISIDAYLLGTKYSDYYGLHFDLYIASNYPSGTIVRYLFSIENGAGTMYSKSPYVKLTYASISSGPGVWEFACWGEEAENLTYNDTIYNVNTGNFDPVISINTVNGTFPMYYFTINVNGNYIAFTYILKDLGGIHAC